MIQDDLIRPRHEDPFRDALPRLSVLTPETARRLRRLAQDDLRRHVDVPGVVDRLVALLGDADDPPYLVAAIGALDARADPLGYAFEHRPRALP